MNQTSKSDTFARVVACAAFLLAVTGIVLLGYSNSGSGQAGQTAGGIGGYTSTEGTYIALNGFGIGTEHSFQQVFNSLGQLKLSATGDLATRLDFGSCYIQPYATTIAASSTSYVDCQGTAATGGLNTAKDTPLTGVTYGDTITADLATSTAGSQIEGLDIISVSASGTPGYIQLGISNGTGGTFTWPTTGNASGTVSFIDFH